MKTPKSSDDGNKAGSPFIDDQYFNSSKSGESDNHQSNRQNENLEETTDLSFIDGQYFDSSESNAGGSLADQMNQSSGTRAKRLDNSYFDRQYFESVQEQSGKTVEAVRRKRESEGFDVEDELEELENVKEKIPSPPKILTAEDLGKYVDSMEDKPLLPEGKRTALDYAVHYRRKNNINHHLSPNHGFFFEYAMTEIPFWCDKTQRLSADDLLDDDDFPEEASEEMYVPVNRTPPYSRMTSAEMTSFLRSSIIYHDADFLAINKPYGLPCQVGEGTKFNIAGLLPAFCDAMGMKSNLHLVHRIDKNVTGVVLLAKHQESASRIRRMFKDRNIEKRYLAVTVGAPNSLTGRITSPIENYFNRSLKMNKMFLAGEKSTKGSRNVLNAVTDYRVLTKGNGACLMYCYPQTGYRHQIRTHLAEALKCPILGDHKYSTPAGNKPQSLPASLLRRFNMKQSKSRQLMMHLHADKLTFSYPTGDNPDKTIEIMAPVHKHFLKSVQMLNFFLPKMAKIPLRRVPHL